MKLIMFRPSRDQLLVTNDIPESELENLKADLTKGALAIPASYAFLSYDDQGGATVSLIFIAPKRLAESER